MQRDNEKIIIHADPEIADLIPGYLANRRRDVTRMREALDRGDYNAIEYSGHSMRGSGKAYGFNRISEIGYQLEQWAKAGNAGDLLAGIKELEDYINRVEVIYDEG